jgi:hypothetical protein
VTTPLIGPVTDLKLEIAFTSSSTTLTPAWEDCTSSLIGFQTRRGRPNEVTIGEAGTADIYLDDSFGEFDPVNTAGPHHGFLRPRRQVRLTCTIAGDVPGFRRSVWRGFTRRLERTWPGGAAYSETVLRCIDRFNLYARTPFLAQVNAGQEGTDTRVENLLTNYGGLQASQYFIENAGGNYTQAAQAYPKGTSLLAALQEAADTELGFLYMEPDGRTFFRNHLTRVGATSLRTFGNTGGTAVEIESDFAPYVDEQQMANYVEVITSGGVSAIAQDVSFQNNDGLLALSRQTKLATTAHAQDQANRLLALRKDPAQRLDRLTIDGTAGGQALRDCLQLPLDSLITVQHAPLGGGTTRSIGYFLEGQEHDVKVGRDARWLTTYLLSAA